MRAHRLLRLAAAALVIVAAAGTAGATTVAPASAAGAPGSESPWWVKGVTDPLYPHHVVYYDTAGGKWLDMADAAAENNALKLRAAAALPKAQAVPSSFWKNATDAVKAGTSKFTSAGQVMEQGNLTRYSRTAVIVAEKVATGAAAPAAEVLTAAAATGAKIPAFPVSTILKGANAAGVAMLGFEVGGMMGAGGMSLLGIDANGVVCQNTGGDFWGVVVRKAGHQDCGAFDKAAEFVPNGDAGVTQTGLKMCGTAVPAYGPANCVQLLYSGRSGSDYIYVFSGTPEDTGQIQIPVTFTEASEYPNSMRGGSAARCQFRSGPQKAACDQAGGDSKFVLEYWFPITRYGWENTGSVSGLTPVISAADDPDRTWSTTIRGSDSADYTFTDNFNPFKESDTGYPTPVLPILPDGVTPENLQIVENGGPAPQKVYDKPTSPEYQELLAEYPECGTGSCMLDLLINDESCFQGNSDCADWFTDPQKETKYSCNYGSHAVALSECTVYADLFKPDGAAISDPETGAPMPGASAGASDSPVMENGVADVTQSRNCFPSGWAVLNPVEWVVRPVQCALEWAFVPRAAIVSEVTGKFDQKWRASTPVKLATAVVAVVPVGVDDSSCRGIAVDLSWIPEAHAGVQYFLPACPGDFFAPIAPPFKILIGIGFIISGFFGITRHVGGVFGYGGLGGEK